MKDIIDRMPTGWAGWVVLVLAALLAALLVMGFCIKYPDIVSGQISISAEKAPVRLVANAQGRLHLLKENLVEVASGEVVGYIESGADYHDVCRVIQALDNGSAGRMFPANPNLGELSSDYNSFLLAYKEYELLRNSKSYANMRTALHGQIATARKEVGHLDEEIGLHKSTLANMGERLRTDSMLKAEGAISEEDYKTAHNAYLSALRDDVRLRSSHLSKQAEIDRDETEIAKIAITESESLQKAYIDLQAKKSLLRDDIARWYERYVLVSPIAGRLEYLGFWRENVYVPSTQELFSIIPRHNAPIGEVYVPTSGAGKVSVGQTANVKISDYPYDEYGIVKGRVKYISSVPNKIQTSNGTVDAYLVLVAFPEGLVTNYGKRLATNFEAKGQIDIVTKPKRLIHRLFDNLKSKGNK